MPGFLTFLIFPSSNVSYVPEYQECESYEGYRRRDVEYRPTVKRVRKRRRVLPDSERERKKMCPTVKRVVKRGKPATESTVAQGEEELPNSETGKERFMPNSETGINGNSRRRRN